MKFQTPRGTRDFLPEEMIRRQYVLDKIRAVFERWGFDPLETPAFEEWALLAAKGGGGEEVKNEIYYFKDKSDRELGLRFEFTASLARVIANNPQLPKPFKRYQMGPVWRYDRPGTGRWREFWQADVDIMGSNDVLADAEVVAVACNALQELGINDFLVRISNRKLIEELFIEAGVKKDKILDAFRSIDKLEKIGADEVKKELKEKCFALNQIKKLLEIVTSDIEKIKTNSEEAEKSVKEIKQMINFVSGFGYANNIKADLALIRGLDYYTGPVFEITVSDKKLSVAGGGRYEKLVQIFGGKPTSATGLALGVERIIEIVEERKLLPKKNTNVKILLVSVNPNLREECIKISNKLRSFGISCEFDLMNRSLQKQLSYANSKRIPFVIIVGEKEIKEKKFRIKDMKTGKEFPVSMDNMHDILDIVK